MKRGKPIILLLTILFAAIAVVFGRNEIGSRNFPFSVLVTSDGVEEELHCMKIWDEYYVFLPSYAQAENTRICTNPVYDVYLDGQPLKKGQSCADFPVNTKQELYFQSAGNEGHETFTFVKSGNVPTMYLDVPSGNMDYIHEKKGNSEGATIRLYNEDGTLDYNGSAESVKGRGNATWESEKKSYSIQLLQEADLLDMGQAENWILLSNTYDRSHIRNKIAYGMAEETGLPFTPEINWVDLYLNGEYAGLYLLSERNEIHPQRVAVDAAQSFLVSVEPGWRLHDQGYPYVQANSGTALRIHQSALPQNTIQQIWQAAENAILAEDGYDPVTGKRWDELIDLDSWARKYLIEEILVNEDIGLASEFFFYDGSDGLIYAGPIWDMDVTLWESELPWVTHKAIIAGRPHLTSTADKNYFCELLRKPAFREKVETLYRMEYRPLLLHLLDSGLEEYASKTRQAALSDQERWGEQDPEVRIAWIREFIQKRLEFLDAYWLRGEQVFLVQILQHDRVWAFAVFSGETLECLPEFENGTWHRLDTGEILDKTLPVDSDLELYIEESVGS